MTQPSPSQQPGTPAREEAQPPTAPAQRAQNAAALSRELGDFLIEFSIVLHKRSMYPAGHPHLQSSSVRFVERMTSLLEGRDSVTLGVARHRLVIESVTTDSNNALLRDLAHRLHRHRIASIQLIRGATLEEVESVLTALSEDPQRGQGPIGRRLDSVGPWDHVRLRAMGFDKFTLQSGNASGAATEGSAAERDAWVELARLALSTEHGDEAADDADPLVVAEAIGQKAGEVAYDRVVLGYLSKVAEEMSGRKTAGEDQLGQRLSRMIEALDPDTLRRLLETGADLAGRRKFALNASQILAADAVMEVVQAAAQATNQTISHHLLRLLHKLAHHAEEGSVEVRAKADGALRNNVARLIGDWELEDPNPTRYTAILEGMVRSSPDAGVIGDAGCAPEIVLKMALELGCIGPAVYLATNALLARKELGLVAELLETSPQTAASETLWSHVATPERLEAELQSVPMDHNAVGILVKRIGAEAANALLDRLASAEDRSTRATVLKQLLALGPVVGTLALERLTDAPWYVQRNILVLIGRLGRWPEGFTPLTYAVNTDSRIRREAIKLLLESPAHTVDGILVGLRDADDGIAALAATAASESCPAAALPLLKRITVDPARPPELRAIALRILARTRAPEALRLLLALAINRRFWFAQHLAPKSPLLLAALTALASQWRDDPSASQVLNLASRHWDPDIRAAAAAGSL
ncbi:MAG TPA: hypothetical protein VJ808_07545 [Gemmatimonadales bacterium]|nr:hypothetical protein [Gemmatimonadales bacterium]